MCAMGIKERTHAGTSGSVDSSSTNEASTSIEEGGGRNRREDVDSADPMTMLLQNILNDDGRRTLGGRASETSKRHDRASAARRISRNRRVRIQ